MTGKLRLLAAVVYGKLVYKHLSSIMLSRDITHKLKPSQVHTFNMAWEEIGSKFLWRPVAPKGVARPYLGFIVPSADQILPHSTPPTHTHTYSIFTLFSSRVPDMQIFSY